MFFPVIPATRPNSLSASQEAPTIRSIPQSVVLFLDSHLASTRSRLLLAVSGGPDSVALAHSMRALPYPVVIGHVDHTLRTGSRADAAFVRRLAQRWELPFDMAVVRTKQHARVHRQGIEEAARDLRYQALVKMAQKHRCVAVVTAHTANDQVETVLLNLFRGTGPTGMAGIPPMRTCQKKLLLRPFLTVTRQEILSYLQVQKQTYRQDPTNSSVRFTRNRIRHLTLPYLTRLFPGLSRRLVQSGEIFRDEEEFWKQIVEGEVAKTVRKNGKRVLIDLTPFLGYHKALSRRLLRHILPNLSFPEIERVRSLARAAEGPSRLQLGGGLFVTRQAKKLVLSRAQ